jgi:glutathione reductase (NADPH)
MVGHSGEELIHILAMAIRHNITAGAMRDQPFAFPTFSADTKNMF